MQVMKEGFETIVSSNNPQSEFLLYLSLFPMTQEVFCPFFYSFSESYASKLLFSSTQFSHDNVFLMWILDENLKNNLNRKGTFYAFVLTFGTCSDFLIHIRLLKWFPLIFTCHSLILCSFSYDV